MNQDAEVKNLLENFQKDLKIVDEFVDKLNAINITNSGQINSLLSHTSRILNIYKKLCILHMEDMILEYEESSKPLENSKLLFKDIEFYTGCGEALRNIPLDVDQKVLGIFEINANKNKQVIGESKNSEATSKVLEEVKFEEVKNMVEETNKILEETKEKNKKLEEALKAQQIYFNNHKNFLASAQLHLRLSILKNSQNGVRERLSNINSKKQAIFPIIASNVTNIIGTSVPLVGGVKAIIDLLNDINKIKGTGFIGNELNIIRKIEDIYIDCYKDCFKLIDSYSYLITVRENLDENENKNKWLDLIGSFNNESKYYNIYYNI